MHESKSRCEDVNECHITQEHARKMEVDFKFNLNNNDVGSLFVIMNRRKC